MNSTLFAAMPLISCQAGQVIIEEGQPIQGIYFLESGEVEIRKGGVLIAEVYESGAVLGEMSHLLKTQPMATVKTLTPCRLRHVADPETYFRQYPEVTLYMAEILARRLDSMSRYLVDIKLQFKDRADHFGIIDEVLDALMHKHPRNIPRRSAGD